MAYATNPYLYGYNTFGYYPTVQPTIPARYGSRGSYGRGMNGGYSRDESKDMMLERLQEVMDMAVDEKDRKAVSRLMEQMDSRN